MEAQSSNPILLKAAFNQKKWWLPLFIVIAAFGIFWSLNQPTVYRTEMPITSELTNGQQIKRIVRHLDQMLKEGSKSDLVDVLGLSIEELNSIQSVEIRDDLTDQTQVFSGQIAIYVLDTEVIPIAGEAIIAYIRNNEYLAKVKTSREEALRDFLDQVSSHLDLTEEELIVSETDQTNDNTTYYALERWMVYLEQSKRLSVVEVIEAPYIPYKPDSLPSFVLILTWVLFGFAASIAFGGGVQFIQDFKSA